MPLWPWPHVLSQYPPLPIPLYPLIPYLHPRELSHRHSCWPSAHTRRSHTWDSRGGRRHSQHTSSPWCTHVFYRRNKTRSQAGLLAVRLSFSIRKSSKSYSYVIFPDRRFLRKFIHFKKCRSRKFWSNKPGLFMHEHVFQQYRLMICYSKLPHVLQSQIIMMTTQV